jgi:hypothetical protein
MIVAQIQFDKTLTPHEHFRVSEQLSAGRAAFYFQVNYE